MGGLISFYAGLYYPQVFGKMIIFSPSFWIVQELEKETGARINSKDHPPQQYYFYAGAKEGEGMVDQVKTIAGMIQSSGRHQVETVIHPEGEHTESVWKEAFRNYFKWQRKNTPLKQELQTKRQ
jgi:predicted alpha/beta superfamily hydrolase